MLNHGLQGITTQQEHAVLCNILRLLNLRLSHTRLQCIPQRFLDLLDSQIFLLLSDHFLSFQRVLQRSCLQFDVINQVKFQLFGNLFICLLNVFGELTLSVFW